MKVVELRDELNKLIKNGAGDRVVMFLAEEGLLEVKRVELAREHRGALEENLKEDIFKEYLKDVAEKVYKNSSVIVHLGW